MPNPAAKPAPQHNAGVDIGVDRLAKVYAQAIIAAADQAGCRGQVLEELGAIVHDVLPKAPAAAAIFASPRITPEEKSAMIEKIFAGKLAPTTLHTLHVLARHDRLGILPQVAATATRLAEEMAGLAQATFTTAVPVDPAEQARIVKEVEVAVGKRLAPTFVVSPELIGGLVVRVADTVYDQSVATNLVRLRGRLKERSIHEIQYGRDRLGTP
jgi:F-type H+-transporting ATPase subunit delta